MTESAEKEPQKSNALLGLRSLQIFSLATVIIGFIWSSGDYMTSLFPDNSVINPVSVLMMLYGTLGVAGSEGIIRFLTRKK
jgi:uncharacterized protein YneF (UPF0154 family)